MKNYKTTLSHYRETEVIILTSTVLIKLKKIKYFHEYLSTQKQSTVSDLPISTCFSMLNLDKENQGVL